MQTKAANQKFIALSDPARLDIVRHLAQGSKTAGELAVPFKVSRPAISRARAPQPGRCPPRAAR